MRTHRLDAGGEVGVRQTMAESQEKELEEVIAERLRQAGLKFATERAIGGLAPDFVRVRARRAPVCR